MRAFTATAILTVSLLGAGCSKKTESKQPSPQAQKQPTSSQNPPVIVFPNSASPNATVNDELNAIIQKFRELKSFRIKFTLPSAQGDVSSSLSFLRPNRFSGTMQLGTQPPTDIIVVDDSLYMRTQGSKWLDLSGTQTASVLSNALRSALNGDTSLDKVGIDAGVSVKKSRDESRSCDLYKAVVRSSDGSPASLEICAISGLPKYVTITTQKGPFSFEYYDYNVLFLIERPA